MTAVYWIIIVLIYLRLFPEDGISDDANYIARMILTAAAYICVEISNIKKS